MHDPDVRFALLCAILSVLALGGAGAFALHLRRSYWKKLRQAGDPRAKLRELNRRRR